MIKAWKLEAIDRAGYNRIRQEHVEAVAEELLCTGLSKIDRETFDAGCRRCAIDPGNFTQSDLDRLQESLSR